MNEFNLPKGWELKTIEDVTEPPQYGYTTKASEKGDVKFLRTTDISSEALNWTNVPYCAEVPKDISKYQLKAGDVVISRAGTIGISALIENDPPETVFASYLIRFRPKINPKYFYYFLQSPLYWMYVNNQKSGIAVQNLNATKIKSFPFPLVSKKGQQEIVHKLDLIFAEIDSSIKVLKIVRTRIELYRQSVLNAAIRGKLVPQNPKDEPASVLLEKIKAEKEFLANVGKLKKEKLLPPVDPNEIPFDLPQNWKWVRISDLALLITKGSSPNWQGIKYVNPEEGIKFITSKNVHRFKLLLNNVEYVEEKFNSIEPRSVLKKGDVLTNIVGASIGRTAVFRHDFIANINQAVCLIRPPFTFISDWLGIILNSTYGLSIMAEGQVEMARANLSMSEIARFLIPLPPESIIKQIVQLCEKNLHEMQFIEASIDNEFEKVKILKTSILKQAFEGKLI